MISIVTEHDTHGNVKAFTANEHSASNVCAAVSLLVINTVNSIEQFTEAPIICEHQKDGGYIRFELTGSAGEDATLLLNAMMLGLNSVQDTYPNEISIIRKEVTL